MKIRIILLLCFVMFCIGCGNQKSSYPDDFSKDALKQNSAYKTYTLILYKKPYMSENFYYFFELTKFNNIDNSFFLPLNVEDSRYAKALSQFFTKTKATSVNMIVVGLTPNRIPLFAKLKPMLGKSLYLFPDSRFKTQDSSLSYKILPENYNYNPSYAKVTTCLMDETFLGYMLQYFDSGSINKSVTLDKEALVYIQGITNSNTDVSIQQGKNQKDLHEKTKVNSQKEGIITGITVDQTLATHIEFGTPQNGFTYNIVGLTDSFLFFNFFAPVANTITIKSFFNPLDINRISTSHGKLTMQTKKLIYSMVITIGGVNQNNISATYVDGELTFSIPQTLLPLSYAYSLDNKEDTIDINKNSVIYDLAKGKLKLQNLIGMDNKNENLIINIEETENPPLS